MKGKFALKRVEIFIVIIKWFLKKSEIHSAPVSVVRKWKIQR